ncbi:DUF11 domain-containing protein [candidate division KSB1 bacterium]|nr:DUF11 domain-containing protein [candidate division KSB1 bacterium]
MKELYPLGVTTVKVFYDTPRRIFYFIAVIVLILFSNNSNLLFAQYEAENPLMDMRLRKGALFCNGTNGMMELWIDVRTIDGSQRIISQSQNSFVFDPNFTTHIDSITLSYSAFNPANYVIFWRYVSGMGVLEYQVSHKVFMGYTQLGGPTIDDWHPTFCFAIYFRNSAADTGLVDYYIDTPHFNVRAAKIPLDGTTVTIHRYELNAPLVVDLACRADIQVGCRTVPSAIAYMGKTNLEISVKNLGDYFASGVVVEDILPDGLLYESSTVTHGSYNPDLGLWNVGDLDKDSLAVANIRLTGRQSGTFSNTARLLQMEQEDLNVQNNVSLCEVIVNPPNITDLAIDCSAEKEVTFWGDTLSLIVKTINNGPETATGITVLDTLPGGLEYVNHNGEGEYNFQSGEWIIPQLNADSFVQLELEVRAESIGTFKNYARIISNDQLDVFTLNNQDSQSVIIQPHAEIQVLTSVDRTTCAEGEPFTITVIAHNNGPFTATNLLFNNIFSRDVQLMRQTGDGDYSSQTGIWSVNTIPSDSNAVLNLTCSVNGFGDFTYSVQVTALEQYDSVVDNNSDSVNIAILQTSDLVLSSIVSESHMAINDFFNLVITIENHGPSPATGIRVLDELPGGATFVVTNVTRGFYDPDVHIWYIGDLPVGHRAYLIFTCGAKQEGLWSNSAYITQMDQYDPDISTNKDFVLYNITETGFGYPNLHIDISTSSNSIVLNDSANFIVRVTNQGPGRSDEISMNSILHPAFELLEVIPMQGTYNRESGEWIIGRLEEGAEITLLIPVRATAAGYLTNYVTVCSAQPGEADFNFNDALAGINITDGSVTAADLQLQNVITKIPEYPQVGDTVHYTLTVRNNSATQTASDIKIIDRLAPGTNFLNVMPASMDYNAGRGEWLIDELSPGEGYSMTIAARITRSGDISNTAYIAGSVNTDSNPENNSGQSIICIPMRSDLEIFCRTDKSRLCITDTSELKVTVVNNGPDAATNIVVRNNLPEGLRCLSWQPSSGNYDRVNGIWNLTAISQMDSVHLVIKVIADSQGVWSNFSAIESAEQSDPDLSDNRQFSTVQVLNFFSSYPDVIIQQSASHDLISPDDQVSFTIHARNNGPGKADHVKISCLPHQNIEIMSAQATTGSYDSMNGLWTVGALEEGENGILTLNARAHKSGHVANYAAITHIVPGDTALYNNQSVVFCNVQVGGESSTDLNILTEFLSLPDTPTLGDVFKYKLTVVNTSTETINGIMIISRLPVGINHLEHTVTSGIYNPASGVWRITNLDANSSQSMVVTVEIKSIGLVEFFGFISQSKVIDENIIDNLSRSRLMIEPTKIYARIYLEGPYRFAINDPGHPDPELMATELRHSHWFGGTNLLPLKSPYDDCSQVAVDASDPSDMPPDIVDWIFLQFRPADCATCTELALGHGFNGVSCLLRSDGALLDHAGREGVTVPGLPQGQYYLIIDHRNHLKTMSSMPLETTQMFEYNFNEPLKYYFDFTEAKTQFFTLNDDQQRGCRLAPIQGKWVVAAGDGDKGHQVESNDYDFWFRNNTLSLGYHRADYDFGGMVEGRDESLQYDNNMLRSPFSWPVMRP